jgi:uncharacterized protein
MRWLKISTAVNIFITCLLLGTVLVISSYLIWNNQANGRVLNFSRLEHAIADEQHARGLMNRDELCFDCAMLFIFDKSQTVRFWMKDTLIALDIIFIKEDGVISNIAYNTKPLQTDQIYESKYPVLYVLEVNSGWADKNNLKEGDKINVKSLLHPI